MQQVPNGCARWKRPGNALTVKEMANARRHERYIYMYLWQVQLSFSPAAINDEYTFPRHTVI